VPLLLGAHGRGDPAGLVEGGLEVDGRPLRDGSRELGRSAAENAQRCVPVPGVVGVQPQPPVGRAVKRRERVERGADAAAVATQVPLAAQGDSEAASVDLDAAAPTQGGREQAHPDRGGADLCHRERRGQCDGWADHREPVRLSGQAAERMPQRSYRFCHPVTFPDREPARNAGVAGQKCRRSSGGSGSQPPHSNRARNASIREWARQHGHEVAVRGRIPASVLDAYRHEVG
jgi:hypothetical protein